MSKSTSYETPEKWDGSDDDRKMWITKFRAFLGARGVDFLLVLDGRGKYKNFTFEGENSSTDDTPKVGTEDHKVWKDQNKTQMEFNQKSRKIYSWLLGALDKNVTMALLNEDPKEGDGPAAFKTVVELYSPTTFSLVCVVFSENLSYTEWAANPILIMSLV